jgi:hypothetical protein
MSNDLERDLRETLSERHAATRPSPIAPPDVLRRARRREVGTVVLAAATAIVLIIGAVGGIQAVLQRKPQQPTVDDGSMPPTEGSVPGLDAIVIDSGEVDGQRWTLAVADTRPDQPTLLFGWEGQGFGGGGLGPMEGSRIFQGYGGSSSSSYPNNDTTRAPLPREIAGQVRSDAARVELRLEGGDVIEASVYALPDDLIGPAKVFLLFVPGDPLLVAGDLVALDASGAEIGREYLSLSPVSLFPKVLEEASPEALEVMKRLQLAGAIVGRYFDTHGSFSGLDPRAASEISTAVTFNTSEVAVPGEVSIRLAGPQAIVLASATPSGEVYAACSTSWSGIIEGRNDTSDPYACTNGWLDPSGPPLETGTVPIATGSDANGNLWSLALIDVGYEWELEYLISTIGTSKPLGPLGTDDLGSIAAIPPSSTPQGAPPVVGLPTSVYGLASERVARVELRTDDGQRFEGTLYPVASRATDAEQVFLVLAPLDDTMSGTVIAYDAVGNELQREHVETVPMT